MDTLKLAQFSIAASKYPKAALGILNQETNVNLSIPEESVEMPKKKKYFGYTYLHVAAEKLDLDCTNKLLDLGADIFTKITQNECTPLMLAIKYSSRGNKDIHNIIGTLSKNPVAIALLSAQVNDSITFNPKCKNRISHLHAASIVNHVAAVELFLNAGAPVDEAINADSPVLPGYTPLHCAVRYSCEEVVEVLLKYGAEIHATEISGKSSLHLLIERLMDIVDLAKAEPDSMYAKEMDKIESIITLILKNWIKTKKRKFKDDTGLSIFHVACTLRDESLVKDFLKGNVDINSTIRSDAKLWPGWTPLHFASYFNIETVKILLQNGASINVKNADGESPLDLCLKRYKPEDMHSILSSTDELANISFSDQSTKLLDVILSMKDYNIFENFLQGLSDVNISIPSNSIILPGCSIMHLAVLMNSGTVKTEEYNDCYTWDHLQEKIPIYVEYLHNRGVAEAEYLTRVNICIDQHCDVELRNTAGLSPIHLAFKMGKLSAVKILLSRCDKDVASPDGLSHFHVACTMGNVNLVRKLLKTGVDINHPLKRKVQCYRKLMLSILALESSVHDIEANSTPLHLAIIFNNGKLAEYLVRKGADVRAEDACKLTPLHMTLHSSRAAKSLARRILSRAKDWPDPAISDGLSYLHVAACANDEGAIERLLRRGANVNAHFAPAPSIANDSSIVQHPWYEDRVYRTPLHVAVMTNSPEAVRALIAGGADIHRKNPEVPTPLQFVLSTAKRDDCLRHFVDKLKSDERRVGAVDDCGLTLLHVACAEFDFPWASNLLRNGADPNARTGDGKWKGKAPLHVLISEARTGCKSSETLKRMVDLLLKFGADVTLESDDASTPLHLAYDAACNGSDGSEEPQSNSEDSEDSENSGDEDAEPQNVSSSDEEFEGLESHVIGGSRNSYVRAVEREVENDVNEDTLLFIVDVLLKSQNSYTVNPANSDGFTHFHIACARNDVESAKKFLEHGVDVNQATDPFAERNQGFTPLHFAFANKCNDAIHLLIDNGADAKIQDALGYTPLHIAMSKGFVDPQLIEILLRFGVDINQQNLKGETPFELFLMTDGFTLAQFEFFLNHRSFKASAYTARFRGVMGLAMKNCQSGDFQSIFTRLIEVCGISYAIHSAVSVHHNGKLRHDNYVEIIERLMELGCELDEKDERGFTALHVATHFFNFEAVGALLMLGADSNMSIYCPREFENDKMYSIRDDLSDVDDEGAERPTMTLHLNVMHALKMEFVGVDVSNVNMLNAKQAATRFSFYGDLEVRWSDELRRLQDVKVNELFTMRDLLSECLIVVRYPTMLQDSRQVIDEFFENKQNLRKKFPELCGLLTMQYRKALTRDKLFESAKSALFYLYNGHFPDSCSDMIFAYFVNDDLEAMILAVDP